MLKNNGMSRRAFIGSALAGSTVATLGLAGCTPKASNAAGGSTTTATTGEGPGSSPSFLTAPEPVAEDDITATKDADVVIVGCGMAGMAAARAAAEEGAKVIVVEKSERFNCRGSMGSQIGAVNSIYQQQAGYPAFDGKELVNRYMQDTLQMANQSFLNHWVDHSGEDLAWFLELCDNVVLLQAGENKPEGDLNGTVYVMARKVNAPSGRYPAYPTAMSINFDPTFPDDAGFYYPMLSFQNEVESKGGEFMYATWGRQLVKDGDRVTGVIVQDADGNYTQVNAAKAVVLSCGDFGNNTDMMEHYAPQAANLTCTYNGIDAAGDPCNVGEGHQMAMWAGAVMEKAPYAPMSHLSDVGDLLLVRRDGTRFINEELGAQSLSNVITRCPGEVAYCVTGEAQGPKVLQPGPDAKQPDPCATVEEAAAIVGCEAAALQQTIDRYNELAAAGNDDDFGKSAEFMTPIEAPYYVYEGHPGNMLVIMGGIDCDSNCRALDADGNPVGGLYVAGNTQGGRFGAEYPMTAPGISHGIALSLGRLAGKNAATLS